MCHLGCSIMQYRTVQKAGLTACAQVDFEPAAALTEEELAARREAAARMSKATRTIAFTLDEQPAQVCMSYFSFVTVCKKISYLRLTLEFYKF